MHRQAKVWRCNRLILLPIRQWVSRSVGCGETGQGNSSKGKMCKVQRYPCMLGHFSHVWLFVTPWTVAYQVPLSMGFSRQKYWSGLPCPPPGDLPNPGTKPTSLMSPSLAGGFFTTSSTWGVLQKHKDGEIGPEDVLLKVITDTQTHPVIPSEHLAYCTHGIKKVLGWGWWSYCNLVAQTGLYQRSKRPVQYSFHH